MNYRNIGRPRQVVGNRETAGRSNTAQAESPKGRRQCHTGRNNLFNILCIQRDGEGINPTKCFEEDAGILEHRQRGHRANVPKTKGRRAVGEKRDGVAANSVIK